MSATPSIRACRWSVVPVGRSAASTPAPAGSGRFRRRLDAPGGAPFGPRRCSGIDGTPRTGQPRPAARRFPTQLPAARTSANPRRRSGRRHRSAPRGAHWKPCPWKVLARGPSAVGSNRPRVSAGDPAATQVADGGTGPALTAVTDQRKALLVRPAQAARRPRCSRRPCRSRAAWRPWRPPGRRSRAGRPLTTNWGRSLSASASLSSLRKFEAVDRHGDVGDRNGRRCER